MENASKEVQPQREELQRIGEEDVLVVTLERPLFTTGRPRLQWTEELKTRFDRAVVDLGGIFNATPATTLRKMKVRGVDATPATTLRKMKVRGVTVAQIRNRLQKIRRSTDPNGLHARCGINVDRRSITDGRSPQLSGQGSSTHACVNGQGSVTFEAGNEESATSKMAEAPSQDEDFDSFLMRLENYSIDEFMAWLLEED